MKTKKPLTAFQLKSLTLLSLVHLLMTRHLFNRVINDIRLIIKNSLNGCDLNDPVQIKDTVSYLKDVRTYLIYLQALYVKKPQAVKIINNLIDDINAIKDIKIDEN